jgi:hypothetical protein
VLAWRRVGRDTGAVLRRGLTLLAILAVVGCSSPDGVRSVADFDDRPCELFTNDVFTTIVAAPYGDVARVEPKLTGAKASSSDGTNACVYSFTADGTAVPQVRTMTVTVAHTTAGSQPYAVCAAGAQSRSAGYRAEKIGDGACLSPSTDLWLKLGSEYFHVVAVPQPGFANPVEANVALSPLLLVVAQATADRMPRS